MPKILNQDKNLRHANFSNVKFAKRFAATYRKHKLHNMYGRVRHINHFKFVKEMQTKYGYYKHQKTKLRNSDKYYERLNPEKWSSARLIEWGEENLEFFQHMTSLARKQKKKKKKIILIPQLPNNQKKKILKKKLQQKISGTTSLLATIAIIIMRMHDKKSKNIQKC